MSAGIIGGIIGVLGGLIGTYFSIRNTRSDHERAFMIRVALIVWLVLGAFVTVILLFPQARLWLMIPYPIVLVLSILFMNKRLMAIRRNDQKPDAHS